MQTDVDDRRSGEVRSAFDTFDRIQDLRESQDDAARMARLPGLVSRYYDSVTRLYEFGWGTSFHFSPRRPGEGFAESLRRHETEIGEILGLKPDMDVLDIGCGVGGPMMTIANAFGASITGININRQQIARGEQLISAAGLDDQCRLQFADFMDLPIEDGTVDAIYSFEALCHAPDNVLSFRELYRVLKPGGEIAIVDWCFTDRFDPDNAVHVEIRNRLEHINATPDLLTTMEKTAAAREAGFEIIQAIDQQAEQGNPRSPWYVALQARDFSLSSWARAPAGRRFTEAMTKCLEMLRIVPRGTSDAAALLNIAADALVEAGELGIFTPSFLVHARKPDS